ncbi:putative Endoplasmic reticulum mannosyl-oligosaccharide 1,2-alpha-mannosidase (putative) [Pseudozyma hubeiensis]|nr:putative Endoplasmic reticulum mannosyl-oligosaccharide 1,2-alpha-mannosidase (putative) [Pseudozyma hubeiensis]
MALPENLLASGQEQASSTSHPPQISHGDERDQYDPSIPASSAVDPSTSQTALSDRAASLLPSDLLLDTRSDDQFDPDSSDSRLNASSYAQLNSSSNDRRPVPSPSPRSSVSSLGSPSSRSIPDASPHTTPDSNAGIVESFVQDSTLRLRKTAATRSTTLHSHTEAADLSRPQRSRHSTDITDSKDGDMFGSTPTASYLPLNTRRQVGPPTSSHLVSWIAKHKAFVIFVLVALIVSVQILLVGPVVMDMEPVKKFREEGFPSIKPPKWFGSSAESPDSWFPSSSDSAAPVVSNLLGPGSFPPPLSQDGGLHGAPQSQDTLYKDTNPHRGELPTYLESVLNKDPVHHPPPAPFKAPTISPEIWSTRLWADRSTTEAGDADAPAKQPLEPEWRTAPWTGWKPPLDELTQPARPLAKVQHSFEDPSRHSGRRNDPARDELIAKRQKMVRNAFIHAWEGYKKHAWGHDELRPVSRTADDPFNGWGASIVDALDTLLVMGLPKEYDLARQHVRDIDFRLVGGSRSAYGSADGRIPVFETAIRYLGGFLSAYDLSGDILMRDRAEELAQLILPAFDTVTGVPNGRIRMMEDPQYPYTRPQQQSSVVLAEAGSLLLEFTRLWQVTGNRTYFDRVQRNTDWLDHNMTAAGRMESLFPSQIYPERNISYGTISFGGMADSYYEYLIKEHQLLGGRLQQYSRMYSAAIEGAKKLLISRVDTVPGVSLMTVGEISGSKYIAKLEHLACFSGGMLGLGSRLMAERRDDIELANGITGTCWWAYNSSTTGIGPENLIFYKNDDDDRFELTSLSDGTSRRGKPRGNPIVGVRSVQTSYLNRPETIESVMYMWRITGDPEWQERGWQMFASWVTHCMTDVGFSAIWDVTRTPAGWSDSMESFTFAETFKYYYLLFSPPELISLDEYVFTTEAHPLLAPKNGKWARAGHGSKKFWDAEAGAETHLPLHDSGLYAGGEMGQVGGLTNNQKQMLWTQWQSKNSAGKIRDLINGLGGDALKNKLRSLVERAETTTAANLSVSQEEGDSSPAATPEEAAGDARQDRLLASVADTSVYQADDGTLEVDFAPNTDADTQQVVLEQLEARFDQGIDAESVKLVLRSVEAIRLVEEEEEQKAQEQALHFARLRSKGIR